MEDLVEKLQLQLDAILFHFEPIGLEELCSFTGAQETEHDGKMKRQLIKIINGKVDTLIEDEGKIEILSNIIGKSKKVVISKPPGGNATINNNNDWNKRPSGTDNTGQPTFHSIESMQSWELSGIKKLISLRKKQILGQADQLHKEVPSTNTSKRGSFSTRSNTYFSFQDLSMEVQYSATSL